MKQSPFKLASILARLQERRAGSSERCLKVHNVTRRTQLGDSVQLAGDGHSRRKGLLGRERLADGEGLWIIPCEAVHTFAMRFPIDLVYLDRQNQVLKTRSNVGPWRLSGCLRAHSVVELPAGTVRASKTIKGDTLALDPPTPECCSNLNREENSTCQHSASCSKNCFPRKTARTLSNTS